MSEHQETPPRLSDEMRARREKLTAARERGVEPYAGRFERSASLAKAAGLPDGQQDVAVAGRVVAMRYFGKLAFGHIQDEDGRLQFALQRNNLGDAFSSFKELVDVGDFIGISGAMMTTKTGEKTVDVALFQLLSKSLRPLPEKFHGLADPEQRLRRRYLDLVTSPEVMQRFRTRTRIVRALRDYLDDHGFTEIDTPILTNQASGAIARPFITHHDSLDLDVYLRIAPETYLKRAIAGGFNRVYEFARSFRNEGMDPSHLPDFTLIEYYCAYWDYQDNMTFTQALIGHVISLVTGGLLLAYQGRDIAFAGEWPRISLRDLLLKDSGVDIYASGDTDQLRQAVADQRLELELADPQHAGWPTIVDALYKKVSRPLIVDPVFVIHHPYEMSPLARRNDDDPRVVDRFQLVVNGWEIVNAYSELVDPVDQAQRFAEQAAARAAGDQDAMGVDSDFLTCMEYGMPPMSGWGMGLDRFVALLTDARTLRDVVLFPLLRPES